MFVEFGRVRGRQWGLDCFFYEVAVVVLRCCGRIRLFLGGVVGDRRLACGAGSGSVAALGSQVWYAREYQGVLASKVSS